MIQFTIRPAGMTAPLLRAADLDEAVQQARDLLATHGGVVLGAAGGGGGVARSFAQIDRIVEAAAIRAQRRGKKVPSA